ncbi:MAG: type II toxin-antitoxin system VapC family toxin [Terriglobales bacterium]
MILLDTHVVLWLLSDPVRLSQAAHAAIDEARQHDDGLAICGITLLEIATANLNGRISLSVSLESFLRDVEERFVVLPISALACARTLTLPASYPKDPADRLIGATALVEGMSLVTADREIRRAKVVRTIW